LQRLYRSMGEKYSSEGRNITTITTERKKKKNQNL